MMLTLALAAAVGLLIGSFLNVVIHRGPARWGLVDSPTDMGSLVAPGSYCPQCRKPLKAHQLMPLVSFALQRGKCTECASPISPRYPLVELGGAVIALLCVLMFGVSVEALLAMIFGWTLLALGVIDLETGYLPDALTLPLIAGGVAFNTVELVTPWPMSLLGAAVVFFVFRFISWAYLMLRKREGLGGGDATLLSAIGAWGGVTILPAVVFIGALVTLAVIGLSRLLGRKSDEARGSVDDTLPFGPGLALAGFVAFLWLRTF